MKTAVVLFNLGGPDAPENIRRFRVNLFSDRAIIRAPIFIRFWLARLIAASSAKAAAKNYALMGGKSPLLELTRKQAAALEAVLGEKYKCFVAMRYWHPFAKDVAREVKAWGPVRVVLLPLYPQYSSTTTGSSLTDWREAAADAGLVADTTALCCYFNDPAFIAATAAYVCKAIAQVPEGEKIRVLYSAHGLPESIVAGGDPYKAQVESTVAAVAALLADRAEHVVCYQSRATPQKWLEPNTVDAITQAGRDGVAVVVMPIAFVSDHIETLMELDIENRHIAEQAGVKTYIRAQVANDDPAFIAALAGIVRRSKAPGLCRGASVCGAYKDCPHAA